MYSENWNTQQYRIYCCCHHILYAYVNTDTYYDLLLLKQKTKNNKKKNEKLNSKSNRWTFSVLFCFFALKLKIYWWPFGTTTILCVGNCLLCCAALTLTLSEWMPVCKHIFIVHCISKISQLHIILRIHWKSPVFGCSLKREKRSISKSSTAVEPKNFIFAFYFIVLAKKKKQIGEK